MIDPTLPSRREILRVGALGLGGLSLERAFELLDRSGAPSTARPRSAILLWLDGGASHIDTFDAKPGAPVEIRGSWGSVPTPVPGVRFGQGMERLAAALPRFALVRSLTSEAGEHEIARHLLLTGYPITPALEYPSYGSVVAHLSRSEVFPPYLAIGKGSRQIQAGFLPAENDPFAIDGDPSRPEFVVRDLDTPLAVTPARAARRRTLLEAFDSFRRRFETAPPVRARSTAFDRAVRLVGSKECREAFDLRKEPDAVRARYGIHPTGQGCLLARRLVEAGARFVTVTDAGWDTHSANFRDLALHRIPKLDQAVPALLDDLRERGLLDDVLVVVMGDFGRTPKINALDGRDHWPRANCALLAGAGVKGGVVVGATDERAETVVERPVSPPDLAATLYTLLGIDPETELETPDGRPIRLVKEGAPIAEILA